MIAPLPPQPAPTKPVDPANAKPDPIGEGDSFAEILTAAAAAVPTPRIPGPPTLDHGPAVVNIVDIEREPVAAIQSPAQPPVEAPEQTPLQAGLTDPTGADEAPRTDRPQPAARIFNQDGFFGASVDAPLSDVVSADAAHAQAEPGIPSAAVTSALRPGIVLGTALPSAAGGTISRSPMPIGAPSAAILSHANRLPPGPLATPLPTPGIAIDGDAEVEAARPLPRRFAMREPGARAPVQVAIRELEQGLHVAARVEGLDAAERVRLHDEISALLARHGRSARSIRLSAPWRAPSQERPK